MLRLDAAIKTSDYCNPHWGNQLIDYAERKWVEASGRSCIQSIARSALKLNCKPLPDRIDEADFIIARRRVELKFWRKSWVVHKWDYEQLKRRRLDVIFATDKMILPPENDIPIVRLGLHSNYLKRDTETLRKYFKIGKNHPRQGMAEDSEKAIWIANGTSGSLRLSLPVHCNGLTGDLGSHWEGWEIGSQT